MSTDVSTDLGARVSALGALAGGGLAPDDGRWREVHRIVFPARTDIDVLPLYVDFSQSEGYASAESDSVEFVNTGAGESDTEAAGDRRSVSVPAGKRYSLGTYFNAFPASYWRRWTRAEQVRFTGTFSGYGTVTLYKSNARGSRQRVTSWRVDGEARLSEDLTLAPFADGGWYWIDLAGGSEALTLVEAAWSAPVADREAGRATIGITTFNRPDYCVKTLEALASDASVLEVLDEIVIVDQGTQKVSEEEGFEEVAARLGATLRIVEQPNLGGSGGFARGMFETVLARRSRYALLLDDDVNIEPEGIVRAVQFGDACRKPTLVGGHMFDMYDRSVLHTMGEAVNLYRFFWGPARGLYHGHNLAASNLRQTPWMHRRIDTDYNGWWMCLIPVEVIEQIGLALPVFIKWDDAEYGLRALEHGFPTVSLPGACVWHVSWNDKDDTIDWQAYYHERNRFLVALLYSPYERGGRLFRESSYTDVKHLISMQYYAQALRNRALGDLLEGPEHLHRTLGSTLPAVRALRAEYPDAQVATEPDAYPTPKRGKPAHKGKEPRPPRKGMLLPWAAQAALHQLRKPKAEAAERPQAVLAASEGKWWELSMYDSAVVSMADGKGAVWYRRDARRFRDLIAESADLHRRMLTAWPQLRRAYKDALPRVTSMQAWAQTFGVDLAEPADRRPEG
ncbi:glycosyltransferase [Kineococcus sp. SYSU DK006]|uniref:glycosyltransferase n=1 Tax=Kineococcus sp. SYSU DK006 TaxID=3383127 RepID=UPI003D7F057D